MYVNKMSISELDSFMDVMEYLRGSGLPLYSFAPESGGMTFTLKQEGKIPWGVTFRVTYADGNVVITNDFLEDDITKSWEVLAHHREKIRELLKTA